MDLLESVEKKARDLDFDDSKAEVRKTSESNAREMRYQKQILQVACTKPGF